MHTRLKQLTLGLCLAAFSINASASISTFDDRSLFNTQGKIHYNSHFDDFSDGFNYPGTPFSLGDITYTSQENLTIGSGTPYSIGNKQTVLSDEYFSPIIGEIASSTPYNLFGFDAAITTGLASFTINTNLYSYYFKGLSLADGSKHLTFQGFKTDSAEEYFTGFSLEAAENRALLGISNVAVGVTSPVPEPASYALLLIGLVGVIARRKQKHIC
ncbi:MAG: PEP-CTERM sorting domain-containing protein [Proteobacteria bacterium]|nr:PEP-CTERM sorting domain-containing protein [Pseudomonadota bacterium]